MYIYTHIYIANTMQIFKCPEVVEFCENNIYICIYRVHRVQRGED